MNNIRLNVSSIPPGAGGQWHYWQSIENADPVQLKASHPDQLITQMRQFRIDNGIFPVGDAEADLIDYYIKNYPTYVLGLKKEKGVQKAHRIGTLGTLRLIDRVAAWSHHITSIQGVEYVYEEEAGKRSQICLACPKNRNWRTCSACGDLTSATDRRINVVLGSKSRYPGLLGCQSCGHDNTAAVWLKTGIVRGADAPPTCWVEK